MIKITLADLMLRMRWRRADLARATGIRPTTIGNWCNEQAKYISLEHLDLICTALDCDVYDIIAREAESTTWSARISTLYAMAQGTQARLIEYERAGKTDEAKYLKGHIDAYVRIAENFYGISEDLFWRAVESRKVGGTNG